MTIYALNDLHPTCDPSSWIAPNASVIGSVILHADSSIWFNTVLRGDNEPISVGRSSNVQDGSVLHTDIGHPIVIGEYVTIGHMVNLHGCTIGDGTLVGIGAIILNGAQIGRNCLIGAGTLIPEGKVIPDGSLVMGCPGKIIRELSQADISGIRSNAEHYVKNAQHYRTQARPLKL